MNGPDHWTGLRSYRLKSVAGELIGALVLIMTGMTLYPVPSHLVLLERRIEPLPQIDVFDGLFIGRAPAVFLPIVNPTRNALTHILAIGGQIDRRRLFQ